MSHYAKAFSVAGLVESNVRTRVAGRCANSPGRGRQHGGAADMAKRTTVPTAVRFWEKVDVGHPLGCWFWTASTSRGYGRFAVTSDRVVLAHRFAFEQLRGPIGDYDLDHLCRNRGCVNPDHLERVTRGQNTLRGEAPKVRAWREGRCLRGHVQGPGSTYASGTHRQCAVCARDTAAKRQRAKSAAAYYGMVEVEAKSGSRVMRCPCGGEFRTQGGNAKRHAASCVVLAEVRRT